VAKPNYAYAKRQRDLAKKQKMEEKKQRKQSAASESAAADPAPTQNDGPAIDAPADAARPE